MTIEGEVDKLTTGCRILAEQNILDAYGHLSARMPDKPNLMIIPRQMPPALVTPDDFIVMDFDGNVVEGSGTPNQEWPIHACVLRARADVNCVLHSHSMWSRIWGLARVKLRGVLAGQSYEWNEGLAIYRDAGLIRNLDRGDKVVQVLGQASAMLLRGHGDVVVGRDVPATVLRSITLRDNAQVLHHAVALGDVDYWDKEEAAPWIEAPATGIGGGVQVGPVANRAWEYYEARIDGRLRKLLGQ